LRVWASRVLEALMSLYGPIACAWMGCPTKLRSTRRRQAYLATIVATLVAVGAVWWIWTDVHRPALAGASVAVLPFDNLSGDPANGRIADGITEDVITDLSRYSEFTVIARKFTEVYRGKPMDVRQIDKGLKVNHVLEGSFQRQGDQVRITAQLIDATTGAHLWSERYDRPAGEVFAIQSDVAERIANSLGGSVGDVSGSVLAAAKRKRPSDLGAYEVYLLGREKMITGPNLESQLEAEKLLERAIQMDPSLARAHAVLAWTHVWRTTLESNTSKLTQQTLREAQRAVDCFRLGLTMAGRYEDVLRNQARQPEDKWNQDGFVMTAGSLAELSWLDEAKAICPRRRQISRPAQHRKIRPESRLGRSGKRGLD
jgi:TolB-like protein